MLKLWFEIFFGSIGGVFLVGSYFKLCWKISDGEWWGACLFAGGLVGAVAATVMVLVTTPAK